MRSTRKARLQKQNRRSGVNCQATLYTTTKVARASGTLMFGRSTRILDYHGLIPKTGTSANEQHVEQRKNMSINEETLGNNHEDWRVCIHTTTIEKELHG